VRPPAPTYVRSTKRFQPTTVPNRAFNGPNTSANGHAAKFTRSSAIGWNE
jgi:hypothetical protein